MAQIRALFFYLGIGLAAIFIATLAIVCRPLPLRTRYPIATTWNRFALWWLEITCGVHWHLSGREHVPTDGEPCIVFCKHQSAWETIALPPLLPPQVLVFKRELLWIPFFGWGLAVLDPIILNRSARHQALRTLIAQGKERLSRGLWITLFPEGTRVAPGVHGRYNAGGAMLAAETGVRVLPIAHNAGLFWPRNSFAKRSGTIEMVFGPVIETKGRDARDIMREAESWIEKTSDDLLAASVHAHPVEDEETLDDRTRPSSSIDR